MNIRDIFNSVSLRERPVDYIQEAQNTYDDYPNTLAHGVQKDAIQNGWDARAKETKNFVKNNWKVDFEILKLQNGNYALSMEDYGTFGLTGNMISKDITDRSEDLPEEERWARWESLAWAKSSGLGARGKGKMILIFASKEFSIFYDSIRGDKSYRIGGTRATRTGCPIFHYDGEEGTKFIKEKLGLEPIKHQGTRVIIIGPKDELLESIRNGEFLSFIGESWWPILQRYEVEIRVKYDGKAIKAKIPDLFPITKDTEETKTFKTWVKENLSVTFERKPYKIKRLCFACNLEKDAPELHQGIACFREGMKVATIKFPSKALRDRVFGYVEFDKGIDKELRKIEFPNHYGFKEVGIWKKLKGTIEDELEAFGNQKLGLGLDRRAREASRRTTAESRALMLLRSITKDWTLLRRRTGFGGGNGNGVGPYKKIGVRLSGLNFPNTTDIPRVDYDDSLEGFKAVVFNRTDNSIDVHLKVVILSGDRTIVDLEGKDVFLNPHSGDKIYGPYKLKITKKLFPSPGEYKLRLFIRDRASKRRVDEVTRRFWVEADPSLLGPFEVRARRFSEIPNRPDLIDREWTLEAEGSGKFTLFYNIDHPAYLVVSETEERLTEYLSELFCLGAMQLVIRRVSKREDQEESEINPFEKEMLLSESLQDVFVELTRVISQAKGQIYSEI